MLTGAAVLIFYAIAVVVAGHGMAPMGAILVMGGADAWWLPGQIIGWIGVFGLGVATFSSRPDAGRRRVFQFLASLVLWVSWLVVACIGNGESGSLWSSFIMSAPFHVTVLVVGYRAVFHKRARAGSPRAP